MIWSITSGHRPFVPIRVTGVVEDHVGVPSNDGTRGCELYKVPIGLDAVPCSEWISAFDAEWNDPNGKPLRHRPGTVAVIGNQIVLQRTNIEEVRDVHSKTIATIVSKVNGVIGQLSQDVKQRANDEAVTLQQHRDHIRDVAQQIDFNL